MTIQEGDKVRVETHRNKNGIGRVEHILDNIRSDEIVLFTGATPRDPRNFSSRVTIYKYRNRDHDPDEKVVAVRGISWSDDEVFLFPESVLEVIK